jgi:acyl carrier protein
MDIIDEVRQVVAGTLKLPLAELAPDTRLGDLGVNSLDVIEVVYALEERFGIEIPLAPDENKSGRHDQSSNLPFETIAEVANAVRQLVDAKPAS